MLITASWLKNNLYRQDVKVIDASWYLPNSGRNAFEEFKKSHIPKAVFFDIDKVSNKKTLLPHMLPSNAVFEKEVGNLGISNSDTIIIYCKEGIISSPRVWWTFLYFGHKKVFVLNGGYKAWKLNGGKQKFGAKKNKLKKYKCKKVRKDLVISYDNLYNLITKESTKYQVLDARPEKRFLEKEHEPRANIGKGKIPGSKSFPFSIFDVNGYLKKKSEIKKIIKNYNYTNKYYVCSCGSGVAACNIALSLHLIGISNWTVYDGSWTQWYLNNI